MKLLTVELASPLIWNICPSDPSTFELSCLPGWSLVNPFLYESIKQAYGDSKAFPDSKATFIDGDHYYINTQGFVLALTDNAIPISWDEKFGLEWDTKLFQLINYFRYASKQFHISPNMKSFGLTDISKLPSPIFPSVGDKCATQAWHLRTALDKIGIEIVSKQVLRESPPAFDIILLDAMEAATHEDYKTAVLFPAIAMENLARMKLDEALKSAFSQSSLNQPLTIVLHPDKDKDTNEKRRHELRELLINNARFRRLLHQSSLILLGKSICQNDKALYDRAIQVYDSRNKMAHQGIMPGGEPTRYSGIKQAREAIQCAIQVVEWFEELGGYVNPLDPGKGIICHTAIPLNSA